MNNVRHPNARHSLAKLSRGHVLSERERQVLKFVAKGLSNKEIAVNMRVSPSTVKRHIENILRKLDLKNRVEAAVHAVTTRTSGTSPK